VNNSGNIRNQFSKNYRREALNILERSQNNANTASGTAALTTLGFPTGVPLLSDPT
jgi:hypothetical protein